MDKLLSQIAQEVSTLSNSDTKLNDDEYQKLDTLFAKGYALIDKELQKTATLTKEQIENIHTIAMSGVYESDLNWNIILCKLLLQPNHLYHDDILMVLQMGRFEESIPYITKAIELKPTLTYKDYDDYGSYYKKCLWALNSIGSPKCKTLIQQYAESNIPELKEEACYRLSEFDKSADWAKNNY